jgi:hypothetical protein
MSSKKDGRQPIRHPRSPQWASWRRRLQKDVASGPDPLIDFVELDAQNLLADWPLQLWCHPKKAAIHGSTVMTSRQSGCFLYCAFT